MVHTNALPPEHLKRAGKGNIVHDGRLLVLMSTI